MCVCIQFEPMYRFNNNYNQIPTVPSLQRNFLVLASFIIQSNSTTHCRSLATINLFSYLYILVILRRSYKWNHILCNLLRLVFYTKHNALEIHQNYSMYQNQESQSQGSNCICLTPKPALNNNTMLSHLTNKTQ